MSEYSFRTSRSGGGNQVLEISEDCYVSYNPAPCFDIGGFGSDDGQPETALVLQKEFYILNGDFRQQYIEAASGGKNSCLEVYRKHKHIHRSSWSTDEETTP
jgi:hypothetical protein